MLNISRFLNAQDSGLVDEGTETYATALKEIKAGPRKGGKIVKTIVGNVSKENWKEVPAKYAREA